MRVVLPVRLCLLRLTLISFHVVLFVDANQSISILRIRQLLETVWSALQRVPLGAAQHPTLDTDLEAIRASFKQLCALLAPPPTAAAATAAPTTASAGATASTATSAGAGAAARDRMNF